MLTRTFSPMNEKNAVFPNGLEAVWLVIAMMMAEWLVCAALHDVRGILVLAPEQTGTLVMVLGNAIVFTGLMHYKGLAYRSLFHASPSSMTSVVVMLFPAIVLTIPFVFLASSLVYQVTVSLFPLSSYELAMFAYMDSGTLGMTIAICILAPVLEEMLFRGIILRSFLQQYERWPAIAGSAALFGFAHMNLYQYIGATIMGMFLGWLYERSRSLLPCIALHAVYNTLCVLARASRLDNGTGEFPVAFWPAAVLLGLAGFSMLRRMLVAPAR